MRRGHRNGQYLRTMILLSRPRKSARIVSSLTLFSIGLEKITHTTTLPLPTMLPAKHSFWWHNDLIGSLVNRHYLIDQESRYVRGYLQATYWLHAILFMQFIPRNLSFLGSTTLLDDTHEKIQIRVLYKSTYVRPLSNCRSSTTKYT